MTKNYETLGDIEKGSFQNLSGTADCEITVFDHFESLGVYDASASFWQSILIIIVDYIDLSVSWLVGWLVNFLTTIEGWFNIPISATSQDSSLSALHEHVEKMPKMPDSLACLEKGPGFVGGICVPKAVEISFCIFDEYVTW